MRFHGVFLGSQHAIWSKQHNGKVRTLRQEIQQGLNVIENWNSANDFAWYGKGGEIAVNNREDQEIAVLSLHLLQICMVYINTLLVQKVLEEQAWLEKMQPEDFRGLTPAVLWPHYAVWRVCT
jgi:hypothetical protein